MPEIERAQRRTVQDSHDNSPPPPPTTRRSVPAPSPRADSSIDANVAAAAQTFNDRILYVGFNPGSRALEVGALHPSVVIAASTSTVASFNGVNHDLATPEGILHFADAVGTTPEQRVKLGTLLGSIPKEDRDELAKIAVTWSQGERGGTVPSRLVLSGHNWGGYVYGDDKAAGTMPFWTVRDLGKIMPKAAAQIEDVHLSCCLSESEVQSSESWRESFPNLKTLWANRGLTDLHPTGTLSDWEVATRGRTNDLKEWFVRAHPPATAWSAAGGIANAGGSIDERRAAAADARTRFDAYLSGEREIKNPYEPAVEHDYIALRSLAAAHDATPAEKASATAQADQMVRLRFWDHTIRGEIAKAYGPQINDALAKEGLPPVDFNTLSRKDALAAIDQYKQKHGSLGPVMRGIVELTDPVVSGTWCH